MRKWLPILVLAAAQFVMVLDTTVMNVAKGPVRGADVLDPPTGPPDAITK